MQMLLYSIATAAGAAALATLTILGASPQDACLWIALLAMLGHIPHAMALRKLRGALAELEGK